MKDKAQGVLICLLNTDDSIIFFLGVLIGLQCIGSSYPIYNNLPALLCFLVLTLSYCYLFWFSDRETGRLRKYSNLINRYKACLVVSLTLFVLNIMCLVSKDTDSKDVFISALAILGTILSLVSWREAFEQNRDIKDIQASLPTHYIGSFPNHLKDIITLINDAKESIWILTDCVDYGSFSDPVAHEEVVQAILAVRKKNTVRKEKKEKEVKIEIRICGEAQPISRSSEFWDEWQHSDDNDSTIWERLRDKRVFQKRIADFCEYNEIEGFDSKNCSRKDFKTMMMKQHEIVKIRLGVTSEPYENLEYLPGLFFWMKDETEAVFLLSQTGPRNQGMAFFTRDIRITVILKNTWENLRVADEIGKAKLSAFDKTHSVADFLKLFPNVKREQIEAVIAKCKSQEKN